MAASRLDSAGVYAGGAFGEITELFVRPGQRSKRVASHLLAAAEAVGRTHGWSRLEVGAPEQPLWMRRFAFYTREGFTEVGPRLKKRL